MTPSWLSPMNLLLHVAFGLLLTVVLAHLGTPPVGALVACLVVGLAKEQAEDNWSDFRRAQGGPLNGLVDVLTWGLGSALYQLWAILT